MFDEPGRGDAGPWQCSHCATRLAAPLMFCPQCGANQLATPSPTAPEGEFAPAGRPRGFADRLRAYCGALPGRIGDASPYGSDYPAIDYDPIDEERVPRRSRLPLYACSALALIAFMLAAYVILPRNRYEPIPGVQVIEGSVGGGQQASPVPGTTERGVPSVAGAVAPRGDPSATGIDADAPPQRAAAGNTPSAPKRVANPSRDVSRQLAIARANLHRNSLWPARRAVMNALAGQPGNDDAQRLRADLASRERERDALLGNARQCARSGQWGCVRQYASRAASVDTSSREARRLLARAGGNQGVNVTQQRADPDLLNRLHRWFEQSIAQAQTRPPRPLSPPWDHP